MRAETWTWGGGTGFWNVPGNWLSNTIPIGANTTELVLGAAAPFTATHNLTSPFQLNRLVLGNSASTESILAAASTETLKFEALTNGQAQILQNGSGPFRINVGFSADAPLHFAGVGTGVTRLNGAITGNGGLIFDAGTWQIGSVQNTFRGGVRVNTGALLELVSPTGPVNLARSGTSQTLLGVSAANDITLDGGTLKLTTVGVLGMGDTGGNITFGTLGLPLTFGPNGGTLDLTNTNPGNASQHAGTIGWVGVGGNVAGGDLALTLSNTAPAVIRFNGGQLGLSNYVPTSIDWSVAQNVLRLRSITGTGPLRIELTNGAMARAGSTTVGMVNLAAPITYRGVLGGNPTSGVDGLIDAGSSRLTGRVAVNMVALNFTGANGRLTLEDALQVHATNGASRITGGITLAGTASGHPAFVVFSGRATGNNLSSVLREPGVPLMPDEGNYALTLGAANETALTIEDGALGVFDARIRRDDLLDNHSGVYLRGNALVRAGGTLRIAQSLSNYSPIPGTYVGANVGDIILSGSLRGEGSTAKEAVLDLRLPAPIAGGTIANGVPTPLTTTALVDVGVRPFGGMIAEPIHQIIINGTGFGGLRVEANPRLDALFSATGQPDGASVPDPTSNLTKLNAYLTAERLAAITGSGGYLTASPKGQAWSFPAGGEWNDAVTVGLRVANHHPTSTDLNFANVPAFRHNLAIETGATVDFGAGAYTFGPTIATAGIGTLHGNGTVLSAGGLTVAAGGRIAPGFGGIGALNVEQVAVSGTVEIDVNAAASDFLSVAGNLVLNATSQLAIPGTSVLGPRNYKIASAAARSGTFGGTPGLPASHSVSYSRPGELWLAYTGGRAVTWTGGASSTWDHTAQNWSGPTAFIDSDRVVFDDSAPLGKRTVLLGSEDVAPASISVNTATNYAIVSSPGAAIVGLGELNKTGGGTLTLTGPASFEGGVIVEQGILATTGAEAIPNAGKVMVANGAQLNLGGMETINSLIVSGSVTSGNPLTVETLELQNATAFQAPLVLQGKLLKSGAPLVIPQTIDFASGVREIRVAAGVSPELTLAGALSNGGFNKTGTGTLLLSGGNSLPSGIVITEGTVRPSAPGAIPANTNITVASGGTLDLNAIPHVLGALDSAGTVTTGGIGLTVSQLGGLGGTLSLGNGSLQVNQATTSRYDGAITTTGSLVKSGSGSLALGGANAIGGGIQVAQGFLRIVNGIAATSGGITVLPGGTLVATALITTPITLAGGTFGANREATAASNDVILAAGTTSTIMIADPEGTSIASEVVLAGTLRGSGNLLVQASMNGSDADTNQGMRLRGSGISDFSGVITVGPRVKLELQSSVAGPFTPAGTGSIVLTAGSAFPGRGGNYSQLNLRNNFNGDTIMGTNVVLSGAGLVNFGPVSDIVGGQHLAPLNSRIILGNLRIGGNQVAAVNKNGDVSQIVQFNSVTLTGGEAGFSPNTGDFGFQRTSDLALGPIGETAAGSGIVMLGVSNLYLLGGNTYTGRTVIQSGTTWLSGANALPAASALELTGGSLLFQSLQGQGFSQTVASLSGVAGTVIEKTATDGLRDFTVNQTANTIFAGTIRGDLNLVKLGAGTLQLTERNMINGTTTVAGGTLSFGNDGQGEITGAVVVQNGGTLTGAGAVGSLDVAAGARVVPGIGPGMLTSGSINLATDAALAFELNGNVAGSGHDQIELLGSLALNGSVKLELELGYQPGVSDTLTLILNDGVEPIGGGGSFVYNGNTLQNGEQFQVATGPFSQQFEIRYNGNDGNDVLLIAVPEPASAVLLLCGLGICGRRRRG